MTENSRPRLGILYTLFVASGVAALIYQLMWVRSFSLIFGNTTRAASAVLASFFLGIALGSWLGGRWTRSRSRALLRYGIMEIAVAIGGLLVIAWVGVYQEFYPQIYRSWIGEPGPLTALQLGLALIAMGPPCVAMGTTLPLISRVVVDRLGHVGRRVGAIYALNTLGATLGVLLSGFLLPSWLGVRGSIGLAAALNIGIGVVSIWLWRRWQQDAEPAPSEQSEPPPTPEAAAASRNPLLILAAAVSGFGTLALEIIYLRLIVNAIDSTVYGFALVLGVFLVSLALGSVLVSAIVDRLRSPWILVGGCSVLTAALVLVSPLVFSWAAQDLIQLSPQQGWVFLAKVTALAAVLMGSTAVLAGVILPTVWKIGTAEVEEVGAKIGYLTFVNTLAGVAGSMLAGFVLIPALGVGGSAAIIALVYGAFGLLILFREFQGKRQLVACLAVLILLAGLSTLRPWRTTPVQMREGETLVAVSEGEGGTVSVTRNGDVHFLSLNSGYGLGGSNPIGARSHRAQGQLPLALHPDPRSVAFIGVATGISTSSILDFPSVERVVTMELIPGVVDMTHYFQTANRGVLLDPRVETVVADGRNHLFGTAERFDVIVGDIFIPWHSGTAYLYTVENFQIVSDRLEPGGVFVQWFQANQLALEDLRTIVASFSDSFEHLELWLHRIDEQRPLLGLLGWKGERYGPLPTKPLPVLHKLGVPSLRPIADAEQLRSWSQSAERNTDDRPIIEFSAAQSHLGLGGAAADRANKLPFR